MLLRTLDLAGTHAVAAAVAALARPGDVIVLAGEMGAGKTAFAQGFGRALGVTEAITSPTFTLVHSYATPGKLTLHHADLYRLDSTHDVDDLAIHELAAYDGIVLVEWGDVAAAKLGDHLEVRLRHDDEDLDADDPAVDDPAVDPAADVQEAPVAEELATDDFADPGTRLIELHATGPSWAGRWDRLSQAVGEYRC